MREYSEFPTFAIFHMNPIDNLYDNISVEHIHPTHSKCMSTNNINKLLSNTVIRDRDTSDLNVFYTYTKMELNSRQMLPINIMHKTDPLNLFIVHIYHWLWAFHWESFFH